MKVEGDVIADTTVEGLADIVGRVVFAANPKHTSEACRGVWIESDGKQLSAMATNVNVLATAQVQLACAPFSMLLSMTAAELLVSLDPKHIALTKSHFSASAGGTELILKPMSYKPINWRKALPDLKNSVTFDSKSLRAAVSMHRHYGDKIGAVRFKSEGTECSLEIVNPDNDALIELDAIHSDDLTEFNYVFSGHQLSQILAGAPDNNVTFFWNAENPRAFLVQNGNWRGVISPLIL
jgi:DNA polymerase III sliding clamp (beta) subunit (PCNA family)